MATCDETRDEQVSVCQQEEDRGYNACSEQKDQGYQSCSEKKDQGYNSCSEQKDLGYSSCQSWSPWFSWICLFSVWISNIACVAWTWISNLVCVAWTWISNMICTLWADVAHFGCAVLNAFMGEATMTVRTGDGADPLADLPDFPQEFLWGAATSSYQVEGGITNNDWDFFTNNSEIVRRVHDLSGLAVKPVDLRPAGMAVHHENPEVLKADLDRLKLLGLNAYRFSLEWSRIQPARPDLEHLEDATFDQAALAYYDDAINQMVARGIEPVLTLNHMSLPLWACTPPGGRFFADENDPGFVGSLRGWNPRRPSTPTSASSKSWSIGSRIGFTGGSP